MVCPKCRKELREYERSCPYPGIRWDTGAFPDRSRQRPHGRGDLDAQEIPATLVTELATDPNGAVLQAANGRPAQLYVIVRWTEHSAFPSALGQIRKEPPVLENRTGLGMVTAY